VRQGSGVVMAPGLVATNAHVVAQGGAVSIRVDGNSWQARIRAIDPGRDLCLLSVPGLPRPAAKAADPAHRAAGMAVQALGFPGGKALSVSRGRLTGIWHAQGGLLLQTDAATGQGSSGGGLFDEEGRLLGLTTLVFERTPGISFSLAVENLDYLLDLPPPGENLTPPKDLVPELVRSIAAHPENHPAWEAFTLNWTRLSPMDPEAWYARGCALHLRLLSESRTRQGQGFDETLWREAQEAFRRATEAGPDLAPAWNNLGSLLDMNNRFLEAEKALRTALALAPDYVLAWINLGRTLFNAGRFRDAVTAYRTALAYRPLDGDLLWSLGLAESLGGATAEGLAHLEQAAEKLPGQAELWADVARQRWKRGDRHGAAGALERLRELNPARAEQVAKDLARP
jgi:Tfp pilus assembly protein PilF